MSKATTRGPASPVLNPTSRRYGIHIADGGIVELTRKFLDHRTDLVALGVAILFGALLFALTGTWPDTPDGLLHLHRVRALADALQSGVIYPRWFPDFAFGYGYPVFNYYAPGFYYPPALLHLTGFSIMASVRITLALSFTLSGWWMFCLLRKYVSFWPAMIGLICFQCFPYRLYDLFIRGALPEFTAFMWLPLIAYYGLQSLESRNISWDATQAKTGLAWAGLILTHNLTAFMAAIIYGLALGLRAFCQARQWRAALNTLASGAIALIIGLLISAWYVVPVLWEVEWVAIGHASATQGYLNHLAGLAELIDIQSIYVYPSAAQATVPLPIYLIPLVIIALLILMTKRIEYMLIALLLTVGAIWLTIDSSAWLWNSNALWGKLQFPWRWHTMIALGTALLLAFSTEQLFQNRRLPRPAIPLLTIVLSGYLLAYSWMGLHYPAAELSQLEISKSTMWQWDSANGQVGATWTGEFLPIWVTEQRWAIGREPTALTQDRTANDISALTITPLRIDLLQHKFQVHTEEAFQMILHQFYFPAWQVTIDDLGSVTPEATTDLGLLSVTVPPGDHTVTFTWASTQAVWLGCILAVMGWLAVLMLLNRTIGRLRVVGPSWFAMGVGILMMTSGMVVPYDQELSTVGADFGMIRLEGSQFTPTQAGEAALINLTWSVKSAGEPLIAFVHLVDDNGAVLAQYDSAPGSQYTPYTRWRAGLVMQSTHPLQIPSSIQPGAYRLKAGLYRPGVADAPLVPSGSDDPRVDIGILKIEK